MKLFQKTATNTVPLPNAMHDIQRAPVKLIVPNGQTGGLIKIDAAYALERYIVIAGWAQGSAELEFRAAGCPIDCRVFKVARPDVAAHRGLPNGDGLGFIYVAPLGDREKLEAVWRTGSDAQWSAPHKVTMNDASDSSATPWLATVAPLLATEEPPYSPSWISWLRRAKECNPDARKTADGYIEGVRINATLNDGIAFGWFVSAPDTTVYLEDDHGNVFSMHSAVRIDRPDIRDARVGESFGGDPDDAGFLIYLPALHDVSTLSLKALSKAGVRTLARSEAGHLPTDPTEAFRTSITAVALAADNLRERFERVEIPQHQNRIRHSQATVAKAEGPCYVVGLPPSDPVVSIVIPVSGPLNRVEHQFLEFVEDRWLVEHAEILYVINDRKSAIDFAQLSESLHRIYRIPFRWIAGSSRLGYSGAANLGVREAKAPAICLLDSDVIPLRPGWIGDLMTELERQENAGAVAPRLLSPDGCIAHGGFSYTWSDRDQAWLNAHPLLGLDPRFDPHKKAAAVANLSVACVVFRRSEFEAIGGLHSDYVLFDIDDSNFGLSLRALGKSLYYIPSVSLTQLECESLRIAGAESYRSVAKTFNAILRQRRFSDLLRQTGTFQ